MGALREGLPGWRGIKTLVGRGVEELRRGGRELSSSLEWAGGRGCRTHAAAEPGCLEPWDMAAPGRTWNADAWPSEGRPRCRQRGPAAKPRNAGARSA